MSHQHGLGKIYVLFHQHVASHNAGLVFFAPVDVVLDSENVVQPDIVFVSTANLRIIEHRAIFGAPDLLMEMLSPSSLRRDLHDKKALYARHGVKEYWIGDQSKKTVEILTLRGGRYQRHCAATGKGKLVSKVLPGLELELADILSDL
jgi:Uma2 family endonuclease